MNKLNATLSSITSSDNLSSLQFSIGQNSFYILLAEQFAEKIGTTMTLVFKETEVILLSQNVPSTANQARGRIVSIVRGLILCEVLLQFQNTQITALVPTATFDSLEVQENDALTWMVQPSEISLMRRDSGE